MTHLAATQPAIHRVATTRIRAALAVLVLGALLIGASQRLGAVASPPLYDGVIVAEPYRYLAPVPNQAGSPTSGKTSQPVVNGSSPAIAASTNESPPQAQLVASPDTFLITPGTTALTLTIDPVAPQTPLPSTSIVGNAYRFAVTDQTGAAVSLREAAPASVVLRAPIGVLDASIVRYTGVGWQSVPTEAAGQPGIFLTNADALGDFALVSNPAPGFDALLIAAVSLAAVALVVVLFVVVARRTRRPLAPAPSPPRPKRRTKRRRNR
jgi:hypothetical protein